MAEWGATRLLTALMTVLGTGCYATTWKPLPPKRPDRRVMELRTATDTLSLWTPQLEGDSIVAGQTLPHGVRVEGARTEDWTYVRIPVEGTPGRLSIIPVRPRTCRLR